MISRSLIRTEINGEKPNGSFSTAVPRLFNRRTRPSRRATDSLGLKAPPSEPYRNQRKNNQMAKRRGGRRPRRYVVPHEVPVWVSGGRWGPRRARVEQCATLEAEIVYHLMICAGEPLAPGWHATVSSTAGNYKFPNIKVEVVANAVWRRGRLFLRCPRCGRRATRLYVPVIDVQPRCRRCWGLNYQSQSWSYKSTGPLGPYFGPLAHSTTHDRRKTRQRAARERYAARRPHLFPPQG